jgi:hypothetical protein
MVSCFPFAALIDVRHQQFLIEKTSLTHIPSLAYLSFFADCNFCPGIAAQDELRIAATLPAVISVERSQPPPFPTSSHVVLSRPAAELEASSEPLPADDDLLGRARRILDRNLPSRDPEMSNRLFKAVHIEAAAGAPLVLDTPALAQILEDFCGGLATADQRRIVSTAHDMALTWNLSKFPLVATVRAGTLGARSAHETSVPFTRALLIAGARRLLVPVSTRVPDIFDPSEAEASALVRHVLDAVGRQQSAADAWRSFCVDAIRRTSHTAEEMPDIPSWALWCVHGLP